MTTNQQIDRILATLYNKQVKQNIDRIALPNYDVLCKEFFADVPDLSEKHYQNLLYMLISKRLVDAQADSLEQAYYLPISLKPDVIVWYEQFHSYLDYLAYLEEKNQPRAFQEDYDDSDEEGIERKSIWATMPLWAKVLLAIILIAAITVFVMGIGKE